MILKGCVSHIQTLKQSSHEGSETILRIPGANLLGDLTDFPVRVDLSDLPLDFWEGVSDDGSNIRIEASNSSFLPADLVNIDRGSMEGELFFRAPVLTTGADSLFKVRTIPGAAAVPITDPIGRNAVWQGFETVFMFSSLENRTGSGLDASLVGGSSQYNLSVSEVGSDINTHQGIAYDGTHYYAIDTNRIDKYDSTWTRVARNSTPLADTGTPGVNHLGDGTVYNGELYIVYEKYPSGPYNNQHVGVFDLTDLSFKRSYDISAHLHEVSSICFDDTNGYFVITDFTNAGSSVLHKYSTDFSYLGTIAIPSISKKQGITYYDGFFYTSDDGKRIRKIALDGSSVSIEWAGSISGWMEGIESMGDGSFLVLFDGSPSAIYRFVGSGAVVGEPGWLNLAGAGSANVRGVRKLTEWTMGASVIPRNTSANGAILSYGPWEPNNSYRASLVLRSSSQYGIWNSSNGWLYAPAPNAQIGVRERLHHSQNGTSGRSIWRNGALGSSAATSAQRPGGSGDVLFMGAADSSYSERLYGSINYVYLREGVLSAAWIDAEYKSWEAGTLYEVGPPEKKGHIFWRINITSIFGGGNTSQNAPSIAEVLLKLDADSPNLAIGGIATASTIYDSSYSASKAFDGETSTFWSANRTPTGWLSYQMINEVEISHVSIQSRPDYLANIQSPKTFTIQSSDDGVAWKDEWEVVVETPWVAGETRTFSNGSPKPDMEIAQLSGVVLSGGGTTTMDISQLGGIVLHEDGEIIHFQDIKYVSSSTMVGMSNGDVTEIAVTLPNLTGIDIESSILLMTIMHRSTVTAPPGWSLVYEQPVGDVNQVTAVYKKDVLSSLDSGTASTWTQSSSARFIGQAHLFTSGVQNKKVVVDSASGATGTSPIEIPPITGSDYGDATFVTASFNVAQNSGTTTLTGPSGYALLSPPSIAQNRLAVAYKGLRVGETLSGNFKTSSSSSNASSISLKLKLEEVI